MERESLCERATGDERKNGKDTRVAGKRGRERAVTERRREKSSEVSCVEATKLVIVSPMTRKKGEREREEREARE